MLEFVGFPKVRYDFDPRFESMESFDSIKLNPICRMRFSGSFEEDLSFYVYSDFSIDTISLIVQSNEWHDERRKREPTELRKYFQIDTRGSHGFDAFCLMHSFFRLKLNGCDQ